MTRRPWFESHEVAAKAKADRVAGRGLVSVDFTLDLARDGDGGLVVGNAPGLRLGDWTQVDRSVHMRPAETSHPALLERAREAVASRVDSAIARSVRWLLSRSGR